MWGGYLCQPVQSSSQWSQIPWWWHPPSHRRASVPAQCTTWKNNPPAASVFIPLHGIHFGLSIRDETLCVWGHCLSDSVLWALPFRHMSYHPGSTAVIASLLRALTCNQVSMAQLKQIVCMCSAPVKCKHISLGNRNHSMLRLVWCYCSLSEHWE